MLPTFLQAMRKLDIPRLVVVVFTLFYLQPCFAITLPTIDTMLTNIYANLPNIMRLVTGIAYVMGIFFVIEGVMKLKQYGEQRSMYSQEHSLRGPIVYIVVGTLLFYLPTTLNVVTTTFWSNELIMYDPDTQTGQWITLTNVFYYTLQLFGMIAMIRGIMILNQLGHNPQPGTFSRGLTHIIAGVFCINMYALIQVVFATLGITW